MADFKLQANTATLNEVITIGYALTGTVGGISVRSRRFSFLKLKDLKPDNDSLMLKIFPNPIQPGQSFQINMQTKKTSNYILKIADAAGKMMMEEKLNITSKSQTETISGGVLQQAGIYFLQISNPADKKDKGLTGKIVVQ